MPILQPDMPLTRAPACRCSGEALDLVPAAPRVGPFPELRTSRCSVCGDVETVEVD